MGKKSDLRSEFSATGTSSLFRIYVVLTTGNERGSETVTVTRP